MSGWICSYRAIWEHPIFAGDAERVGVWDWMLKKAAWKPTRFRVAGEIVTLDRGQLCVSQKQVCEETGISRQRLRALWAELEREHAITKDATKARTIITICKYDNYQNKDASENQRTGQDTTKEQPTKEQVNTSTTVPVGAQAPSEPVQVSVVTTALWQAGKQYLASQGEKNPGAMIGRWLKSYDPVSILNAIEAAQKAGTQDPIPYITESLKGKQYGKPPSKSDERLSAFIAGARGAS